MRFVLVRILDKELTPTCFTTTCTSFGFRDASLSSFSLCVSVPTSNFDFLATGLAPLIKAKRKQWKDYFICLFPIAPFYYYSGFELKEKILLMKNWWSEQTQISVQSFCYKFFSFAVLVLLYQVPSNNTSTTTAKLFGIVVTSNERKCPMYLKHPWSSI